VRMSIYKLFLVKSSELVQCANNWPMSAHASQDFSIAHCTNSEDLPMPTYAINV